MQPDRTKKNSTNATLSASNTQESKKCPIVAGIKVAVTEYQVASTNDGKNKALQSIGNKIKDLLQLYTDNRLSLTELQKVLFKAFPKKGQHHTVRRAIVSRLLDAGILGKVITSGDCEALKTLLAVGDQQAFQDLCLYTAELNQAGNVRTAVYSLYSFAVCHGTHASITMLQEKGYRMILPRFPQEDRAKKPEVNPITLMIDSPRTEPEIVDRCQMLLAGLGDRKRKQLLRELTCEHPNTSDYVSSPLCSALQKEYFDLTKLLLEGADAGQACFVSERVYYPIIFIIQEHRADLLQCIPKEGLQALSSQKFGGWTIFQQAINERSTACIRYLLDMNVVPDVDVEAGDQVTALMVAAACNDTDLARALLKAGADPCKVSYSPTQEGLTALAAAVYAGSTSVVELLLSKGADPHQESQLRSKATLLHLAVFNKHFEILQLLLQRGVSLELCDTFGYTALEMALMRACVTLNEIKKCCGSSKEDACIVSDDAVKRYTVARKLLQAFVAAGGNLEEYKRKHSPKRKKIMEGMALLGGDVLQPSPSYSGSGGVAFFRSKECHTGPVLLMNVGGATAKISQGHGDSLETLPIYVCNMRMTS